MWGHNEKLASQEEGPPPGIESADTLALDFSASKTERNKCLLFICGILLWQLKRKSQGLCCLSSVQFSHSVVSYSLRPHESQHARAPCPSPTPRVHSDSSPSSQWCHPAISSSVVPFSSCPQSLPASGSFQMSQFLTSGGQSIGVSASTSVPPMNS